MRKPPKEATLLKALRDMCMARDGNTCQVCGKYFPEGRGLDTSHHVSRRKGSTKYYPDNVSAKCRECHTWMDNHPLAHADWIRERLGEERWEALKERERDIWAPKTTDKREILAELKRLTKGE